VRVWEGACLSVHRHQCSVDEQVTGEGRLHEGEVEAEPVPGVEFPVKAVDELQVAYLSVWWRVPRPKPKPKPKIWDALARSCVDEAWLAGRASGWRT
jgi:hypothetical protein